MSHPCTSHSPAMRDAEAGLTQPRPIPSTLEHATQSRPRMHPRHQPLAWAWGGICFLRSRSRRPHTEARDGARTRAAYLGPAGTASSPLLPPNPHLQGITVHHDHSLRRALNRGNDFQEGPQTEFVEDHGFLIETDKIGTVIDPRASFTLEYLDMIMTIRAKGWKVLFVPTARLEFRITEFSWRDIPYFMYKRSEATAHGTRDYLKVKWQANFPNTGFWTYIKYTIVEQHVYKEELSALKWKDQAALVFGFFQMAGYNHYAIDKPKPNKGPADFLDVLQRLDQGWAPKGPLPASRQLSRPAVGQTRPSYVNHLDEILPYGQASSVGGADFAHEYIPFAVARLSFDSCAAIPPGTAQVCGLMVEHAGGSAGCDCWINMPTFKSNSLFVRALSKLAALIKVPSRISTFIEMSMAGSGRDATAHVEPLRAAEAKAAGRFQLFTCDLEQVDCTASFGFPKDARLKLFRGAPAAIHEVLHALAAAGL